MPLRASCCELYPWASGTAVTAQSRAFHFTSIQSPRVMHRFLRPSRDLDVCLILDLEDGVGDLWEPMHTLELKRIAREHIVNFVESLPSEIARQLGVRVNAVSAEHFGLDLAMLASITPERGPRVVVVPKVSSGLELDLTCDAFTSIGVDVRGLVPIVESVVGLARLDDIVSTSVQRGLAYVVYGHFDYCLDSKAWPFPGHNEAEFWHTVTDFIGRVERGGLSYVHPPISHVLNDALFRRIRERLETLCRRAFGMITVTSRQSSICHDRAPVDKCTADICLDLPGETKPSNLLLRAQSFVAVHESNRRDGNTFAMDGRTGQFITQHEYLAARRYLDTHGE